MLNSLKTKICVLISLILALVAAPVLYFTHKDVTAAMSASEQRSARNVLELAERNIRSGYTHLLYSRVDAVKAHRRMLEGMVLVAEKGLDTFFPPFLSPPDRGETASEAALRWINNLATVEGTEFLIFDTKGFVLAHPDARVRGTDLNDLEDIKGLPLADAVREEATDLIYSFP